MSYRGIFFKWAISCYSGIEQNFEIPKPGLDAEFYEKFNYGKYEWGLFATDEFMWSHFISIWVFELKLSRDLAWVDPHFAGFVGYLTCNFRSTGKKNPIVYKFQDLSRFPSNTDRFIRLNFGIFWKWFFWYSIFGGEVLAFILKLNFA